MWSNSGCKHSPHPGLRRQAKGEREPQRARLGIRAKDVPAAFQKGIHPKNGNCPSPTPRLSAQTPRRGTPGNPAADT